MSSSALIANSAFLASAFSWAATFAALSFAASEASAARFFATLNFSRIALILAEFLFDAFCAAFTARLLAAVAFLAACLRAASIFLRAAASDFFSASNAFCNLPIASFARATAGETSTFFGTAFLAGAFRVAAFFAAGRFLAGAFLREAGAFFAVVFFFAFAITFISRVNSQVTRLKNSNKGQRLQP